MIQLLISEKILPEKELNDGFDHAEKADVCYSYGKFINCNSCC
jgi:hypothetical protein